MTGYIRLEGVNIYDNLGDTNQLSVIRGGSLFLKDAIQYIANQFENSLKPISTGASLGLFETTENDLTNLCYKIQQSLLQHDKFQHLTFTLVSLESDDDFIEVEAELTALSRFQQIQQLNIVSPTLSDNTRENSQACAVQGVRPATKAVTKKDWLPEKWTGKYVSQSVLTRAKAGVENRKSILASNVNEQVTLTRHFEALSRNQDKGNLDGKLALVYFDGNSFGKLRDKVIKANKPPLTGYKHFDKTIVALRDSLRTGWVSHVSNKLARANSTNKEDIYHTYIVEEEVPTGTEHQLRFESLLWGGDELLFVLPAWLGFEFLQFFNEQTQHWKDKCQVDHLTHAGGLIFCKAKTPIFRVRDLASRLADNTKESPGGRQRNLYDLMLLESVDFPAEDLDTFRKRTYGAPLLACRPPIDADLSVHLTPLAHLLKNLPKSQVYQVCQLLQTDYAELTKSHKIEEIKELILTDSDKLLPKLQIGLARFASVMDKDEFTALKETLQLAFGDTALTTGWCWIWLREYWDYLEPLAPAQEEAH